MRNRPPALLASLLLALAALSFRAPAAKLDPAAEEFLHMTRYFMTNEEQKAFRNLATPELRREFIEAFWEIRDPDPGTAENEFRVELEARFEFVNRYLREANRPGWDTARGMVYMVLGPPSIMTPAATPVPSPYPPGTQNVAGVEVNTLVWPYRDLNFVVYFIDRQGFGIYELDMLSTSPRLMELMKAGKTRVIRDEKESAERFLEFDSEIAPGRDTLIISIPIKALRFDIDAAGGYAARIHLAANIYMADGAIATHKDDRRIVLDAQTEKKGQLRIEWTIPLKKEKSQIDLLVLDQVGGKSNRHFINVKKG